MVALEITGGGNKKDSDFLQLISQQMMVRDDIYRRILHVTTDSGPCLVKYASCLQANSKNRT